MNTIEIDTWSDEGEWICPYCGYVYEYDQTEDMPSELEFEDFEWECPKCKETYLVSQRCHFTHRTKKLLKH